MKKLILLVCLFSTISFFAGYALCFVSKEISSTQNGNEYRQIEELKNEASSFFYKAMQELYEGTYNHEDSFVSTDVLETFKKYRPKLASKCCLVNLDEAYGTFYGIVFFQSEYVFIVEMKRLEEKWKLITFDHVNTNSFWSNLQLNKD